MRAHRNNEAVTIRLFKSALSGNDVLLAPMNTVKKLAKHKNAGKGMEITISKSNIRKQTGSGGPQVGKSSGGGAPRIGRPRDPIGRPPPFIGTWDKQYGSNPYMSMIDPLNGVILKAQDLLAKKKKKDQRSRSKWAGSKVLKLPSRAKKRAISFEKQIKTKVS